MTQKPSAKPRKTASTAAGARKAGRGPARTDMAGIAAVDGGADVEQRIYQSVFDGVLNQRLPPGTKLPEPALCSLFGVSRAVVRKVLQRLEHDRIVELRPNRGAVVAAPTPEETRKIFEARRALEAALVELAVQRHSGKDIEELHALLHQEEEAMANAYQPAWAQTARNFHLRVAALGGNPILLAYLTELISRCSLIVALYEPAGNAACEHEEHCDIVDAISKGDAKRAVAAMNAHLVGLEERICLERPSSVKTLAQMLNLA
ncbi:GntR family transcriptional regulator [Caulobacter sp. 602-2]|uniref:GntR family transcriptional regulator n=1 Tax=Caulobacter sp. 602-2 TaxID=2710887 RepID=A0A6G4QQU4_9CAUL|nr:GntR family transcriptional regulator [Caulobacter sp. 602-2]NGM47990.1 GntR family transcriptional regulator [Caulobacter sp. 602-2]